MGSGTMVLFGGYGNGNNLADLWEFTPSGWGMAKQQEATANNRQRASCIVRHAADSSLLLNVNVTVNHVRFDDLLVDLEKGGGGGDRTNEWAGSSWRRARPFCCPMYVLIHAAKRCEKAYF